MSAERDARLDDPSAPDDGSAPASNPRRATVATLVALCCVGTFVIKWFVNQPRTFVGYGDVANYYTVARNLALGTGFQIDYVWNFLSDPQGMPTPSNVWWMPLPSLLCALGMKLGDVGYAAAQSSMIVLTSLVPWAVYLLGRDLFGRTSTGLLGALAATSFHLFMDQPCAPLSHGPYLLLSTWTLWLVVRAVRSDRWLPACGGAIALTQLARSDGVLLFVTLTIALLVAGRRPRLRAIVGTLAAYAVLMAPWWLHNLEVHGAIMPRGPLKAALMRTYPEWYSPPGAVSLESYLSEGWEPILQAKLEVGRRNLVTLATGMTSGATRRRQAWDEPSVVALMALSWLGAAFTLRRRFVFVWAHAAALWAFYSLLFTAVGPESFRTGVYSLYPFLILCAADALRRVSGWASPPWLHARRRTTASTVTCIAVLGWIGVGQFLFARDTLAGKGGDITRLGREFEALDQYVLQPRGLHDGVVMARNVHALHAHTGLRCVQIPYGDIDAIRDVARRFGVDHVLLQAAPGKPWWPAAFEQIDELPDFRPVLAPTMLGDRRVAIYRFEP